MRKWSALLLLALAAGGCGRAGAERTDAISRERFVAANVALRTVRVPSGDSAKTRADSVRARADSARARQAVLKKQGLTPAQLQGYLDAHRGDTEALATTWKEISDRITRADSVARADSARKDSARTRADSAKRARCRRRPPGEGGGAGPHPKPLPRKQGRVFSRGSSDGAREHGSIVVLPSPLVGEGPGVGGSRRAKAGTSSRDPGLLPFAVAVPPYPYDPLGGRHRGRFRWLTPGRGDSRGLRGSPPPRRRPAAVCRAPERPAKA